MIRILILITILFVSCSEDMTQSAVKGCTTSTACNYNADANINDGSCIETQGCNDWCAGDETTLLELDCAGECGGEIVEDDCGECLDGIGADATPEDDSTSTYNCAMACDGLYYNDDTAPSTHICNGFTAPFTGTIGRTIIGCIIITSITIVSSG